MEFISFDVTLFPLNTLVKIPFPDLKSRCIVLKDLLKTPNLFIMPVRLLSNVLNIVLYFTHCGNEFYDSYSCLTINKVYVIINL